MRISPAHPVVDVRARWACVTGAATPTGFDATEMAALARLRLPEDRARYVAAHVLLREVLAEHTGIAPERQRFLRRCRVCGGPHGPMRLLPHGALTTAAVGTSDGDATATARPGPDMAGPPPEPLDTPWTSISHAGDRVIVALREDGPVGVDLEPWVDADLPDFATVALTRAESEELARIPAADHAAACATWWVRKEAVLKAEGVGLRVDPCRIRVTRPDRPAALVEWDAPFTPTGPVAVADVPLPGPWAAAVAAPGAGRLRLGLERADDL